MLTPKGWEFTGFWGDQMCFQSGGLRVIAGLHPGSDGREWLHVSASRKQWTPKHEDMARVKADFIGEERYAYAVFPPANMHVNIHPNCLHLWACLIGADGRILPEFSEIAKRERIWFSPHCLKVPTLFGDLYA